MQVLAYRLLSGWLEVQRHHHKWAHLSPSRWEAAAKTTGHHDDNTLKPGLGSGVFCVSSRPCGPLSLSIYGPHDYRADEFLSSRSCSSYNLCATGRHLEARLKLGLDSGVCLPARTVPSGQILLSPRLLRACSYHTGTLCHS